jgi:hypothetical protein
VHRNIGSFAIGYSNGHEGLSKGIDGPSGNLAGMGRFAVGFRLQNTGFSHADCSTPAAMIGADRDGLRACLGYLCRHEKYDYGTTEVAPLVKTEFCGS